MSARRPSSSSLSQSRSALIVTSTARVFFALVGTGFEPVREALTECRRVGEHFVDAWPRVLETASPEDRSVLESTRAAWASAYGREGPALVGWADPTAAE
jgi:hypothetical protein